MNVRPPAVAGMFYPDSPAALAGAVDRMLAEAPPSRAESVPKALIVPHAGYMYSGTTAAAAYAQLKPASSRIRRVVLLGPTHRVAVAGLALPEGEAFTTPLGDVHVDAAAVAALAELPQVVFSDRVHANEHSLEVHLPFLQRVLEHFTVVPLAVGDASTEEVAEVIDLLWGGPETLIVVSTDLSHFLPYDKARSVDDETCQRVLKNNAWLETDQACGAHPLNGLLLATQRHGLMPELVATCNSGDTGGSKDRVVGYASFVIRETRHV